MRSLTITEAPPGQDAPDEEDIAYNQRVNALIHAEIDAAVADGEAPEIVVAYPGQAPEEYDTIRRSPDGSLLAVFPWEV